MILGVGIGLGIYLGAMRAKNYLVVVDSEGNAWVSPDNELMLQEQ